MNNVNKPKGAVMRSLMITALFIAASIVYAPFAFPAEGQKLVSDTGSLLRGSLYKQSGIAREGFITIRTSTSLPREAPVFRYDFDILHGRIDGNLYSFMMGDIAEMEFLPIDGGTQPVNIKLKNGVIQKVVISSDEGTVLGPVNLGIREVSVLTDSYGENIVTGGEVYKIVFTTPVPVKDEHLSRLVNEFGKALEIGKRDGLVNEDFLVILEKLHNEMDAKLEEKSKHGEVSTEEAR